MKRTIRCLAVVLVLVSNAVIAQLLSYPSSPTKVDDCLKVDQKNDAIAHEGSGATYLNLRIRMNKEFAACQARYMEYAKGRKRAGLNAPSQLSNDVVNGTDRSNMDAVTKATELRDQVKQGTGFAWDPGAAIVQSALDAAYGNRQETGDPNLDYTHDRERELIDSSHENEVVKSIQTESSKVIQRVQGDQIKQSQDIKNKIESFANSSDAPAPRIALRGAFDAPARVNSPQASVSVPENVPYRSPERFVDPVTQEVFVIPEGFVLYRSAPGSPLSVMRIASVGSRGDGDGTGQCSESGIGRVMPDCERARRAKRQ